MWITNKDGFFSVIQHNENEDNLMVRMRSRKDAERLQRRLASRLGTPPEIVRLEDADYLYRITVPRMTWALYMAGAIEEIDYEGHVKEALSGDDDSRYEAMVATWLVWWKYQEHAREAEDEQI